ncbi:MAG: hypothetical protein ACREL7_03070 [Longimicrobiales bacterium]
MRIGRVHREIGQVGMAVVLLADDLKHGRRVAIKVLRPELAAAMGGERFLREIEVAAQQPPDHPAAPPSTIWSAPTGPAT